MIRRRKREEGLALMTVLMLTFVLMVMTTLVLDLSTREAKMTGVRRLAAQSLFIAEAGAVAGRGALMALMGAFPLGDTDSATDPATIDVSLTSTMQNAWYSGGTNQRVFAILDYILINGQRFSLNPGPTTTSVTFNVNWALPNTLLKLQTAGPVSNTLGGGSYQATVTLTPNPQPHASCTPPGSSCPMHFLGGADYEYFFNYTVTSTGTAAEGRRRVTFSGNFSLVVRRQSFARFALFTDTHLTPANQAIWFANITSFDGPVHTNGEFRFAFFPKFGTPDPGSPCNSANIKSTTLTSANSRAWFYNSGSPVELSANENVVGGVRRDAPVLPDCTPTNITDDNDNPAANFTRGVPTLSMPTNSWSQKGVSIGRSPADTSSVTNTQIRAVVPELADTGATVPTGIYIPRAQQSTGDDDPCTVATNPCIMSGGIYVQGDLNSLTLSYSGDDAIYTLVQGSTTVTIRVNRVTNTTTITHSGWPSPQTRTYTGVPKGYQPDLNDNATMIYVEGNINALSGQLGRNEQTTIAAAQNVWITGHITYENPPNTNDPNSNPINLLGVFTERDIIISDSAPNDLNLHGVFMAGTQTSGTNSAVRVNNYDTISPKGNVNLIGGIIEKYYGAFGRFNSSGNLINGYGRNFTYDRRMNRGFTPPFFPTTPPYEMVPGTFPLAGARPVWRESTPP